MRTRLIALLLVQTIGLGLRALAAGGEHPPNIVLIYADDLGWGDVGFNGRTEWATPNLDRLGARGTIFKRWYTAAVVCAPSRAAMLTGKATIHCGVCTNGADLPGSEVTIAEALKARGYATALFGKWHHGKPQTPRWSRLRERGEDRLRSPDGPGFRRVLRVHRRRPRLGEVPQSPLGGPRAEAGLGLRRRPVHRPSRRVHQAAPRPAVLPVRSVHRRPTSTSRPPRTRSPGTGAGSPRLTPPDR